MLLAVVKWKLFVLSSLWLNHLSVAEINWVKIGVEGNACNVLESVVFCICCNKTQIWSCLSRVFWDWGGGKLSQPSVKSKLPMRNFHLGIGVGWWWTSWWNLKSTLSTAVRGGGSKYSWGENLWRKLLFALRLCWSGRKETQVSPQTSVGSDIHWVYWQNQLRYFDTTYYFANLLSVVWRT